MIDAAGGLVVDADGRLAIVHRPHRADWSLPKGHLDEGETHEQAALREVFEETGLRCRITGFAAESHYDDAKGRPKRVRYFTMTVDGGSFTPNDEVDELQWIGPDDVGRLTYAGDAELVRRWWPNARPSDQRDE